MWCVVARYLAWVGFILWVPVLGCVFGYVVEVCVGWDWGELVLWCWGCGVGDEVGLVFVVAGVDCCGLYCDLYVEGCWVGWVVGVLLGLLDGVSV